MNIRLKNIFKLPNVDPLSACKVQVDNDLTTEQLDKCLTGQAGPRPLQTVHTLRQTSAVLQAAASGSAGPGSLTLRSASCGQTRPDPHKH